MGWIRISDDFYDNDKLSDVGPLGVALYFASMGFCNRNLTDGFFKKSKARLFLDFDGIEITTVRGEFFAAGVEGESAAKLVIEWMVAADLWHEDDHDCDECHARDDGGEPGSNEYLIHDYLEFQFSKAQIEAKAEANRKRVEAWRDARKGGNGSSNGSTNDVRNGGGNDVGNALHTDHVHDTPTPTPTVIPNGITSEGGVSLGSHQAAEPPPPRCTAHKNHDDPPACHGCRKAREANEAWAAGEFERRRTAREAAKAKADACATCGGTNWIPDTDPAVKCNHQEAM